MTQRQRILLPAILLALGSILLAIYFTRPVTLVVDGQALRVRGWTTSVGDALRLAGVAVTPGDRLSHSLSAWIPADGLIYLERSRPVSIWSGGLPLTFSSAERIPGNLLAGLGLKLYPSDSLHANGRPVDPNLPLPYAGQIYLEYRPAVALDIREGETQRVVYSAADTLGQALWELGAPLQPGDWASLPLDTPLVEALEVSIQRARPLAILVDGRELRAHTSAQTTGEALADAGIALQGLDYSQPAESEPLPADGRIRVVRVREEVVFQQTNVPFESSYAPDPSLELDARSVITPGKYGVKVSRSRVRYADGQEVSRQTEAEWVATEPQDQVLGYGTQAVVKTISTPDGDFEYYRAVPMYATSYSPCQQGLGRCSLSTSSGIPLKKGVVAVTLAWYRMFRGAQVYVPGYGVGIIGDVGGGIPGTYWIDLGYSEEDFVSWAQTVTVYFLTPVPANVAPLLP